MDDPRVPAGETTSADAGRGDAVTATRIFRGAMGRGDAAAATWIVRGGGPWAFCGDEFRLGS